MAVIGLPTFAVVLWGSVLGVALVFLYELIMIERDIGWFYRS